MKIRVTYLPMGFPRFHIREGRPGDVNASHLSFWQKYFQRIYSLPFLTGNPTREMWEIEKIHFPEKESLLLCGRHSTQNGCNSLQLLKGNNYILNCLHQALFFITYTQKKLKENYSGQTQGLKNKKMPGVELLMKQYQPPAVYTLLQNS